MKDNFGSLKNIPANWKKQALSGHNAASGDCSLYVRGINAKRRFAHFILHNHPGFRKHQNHIFR